MKKRVDMKLGRYNEELAKEQAILNQTANCTRNATLAAIKNQTLCANASNATNATNATLAIVKAKPLPVVA